jgi:hypothetical protein
MNGKTEMLEAIQQANPVTADSQNDGGTAGRSAAKKDNSGCPQCGSKQSWGLSSWCPECGYYPSIDASPDGKSGVRIAPEFRQQGDEEPATILHAIPVWMWIALGGMAGIFAVSVGIRVYYDGHEDAPTRLSWMMVIAGLTSTITAHALSLRYAMRSDARVTLSDGLVAWIAVWQPTIADLPATRRRLWSLIWGCTVMLCAVGITGGMDLDWLLKPGEPFYVKEATGTAIGAIADAARQQQPDADSMEEALHSIAGDSAGDPTESDAEAAEDDEEENTVTGTIFGFQKNRRGIPVNFMFSGITRKSRQHIATIPTERLTEEQLKTIVTRLHNTIVRRPATPTVYSGTWVEPEVDCRLTYDAITETGTLVNPQLLTVLKKVSTRADVAGEQPASGVAASDPDNHQPDSVSAGN